MGSSVIWCYIDVFGPERLSKIILVDQPPVFTSDPHWTQQELADSGAVLTAQQVFDTVAALRSKEAEHATGWRLKSNISNWMGRCYERAAECV